MKGWRKSRALRPAGQHCFDCQTRHRGRFRRSTPSVSEAIAATGTKRGRIKGDIGQAVRAEARGAMGLIGGTCE